jgi:hypothetical protein
MTYYTVKRSAGTWSANFIAGGQVVHVTAGSLGELFAKISEAQNG